MNWIFEILISIAAALAVPVGGLVGLGLGVALTKLGDVDGPPGGVGVIFSVGLFGLLFGIGTFIVCLRRLVTHRTRQADSEGTRNQFSVPL